jgi:hypothetical protein
VVPSLLFDDVTLTPPAQTTPALPFSGPPQSGQ